MPTLELNTIGHRGGRSGGRAVGFLCVHPRGEGPCSENGRYGHSQGWAANAQSSDPRMGGLAIFLGFILSVLVFLPLTTPLRGMLLGACVIVVLGILDDIYALSARLKFVVQILAALIAALHGNVILAFSNPNIFSDNPIWNLGKLSLPVTVLWIVAITNAVNLIDGLDGLACGVSTISSMTNAGHRPVRCGKRCGHHDGGPVRRLYRVYAL